MAKGKFSIGLILGAAVGAVAGLLSAPKAGKETREDLKRHAGTVKGDLQDKFSDVKSKFDRTAADVKERAEVYKERVQQVVEDVKDDLTKGDSSDTSTTKKHER